MKKKLLRGALVVFGLVAIGVVVLLVRYPPDTWKDRALVELTARTGIEATAEEASVSFFPLGLELTTVALTDDQPGQPYQRMEASMERAVVRAELMSLVRGAPHVNEIHLSAPKLEVWQRPEAMGKDASGNDAASAGMAAVLGMLAIDDGEVTVHQPDGGTLALNGLRQRGGSSVRGRRVPRNPPRFVHVAHRRGPSLTSPLQVPPLEFALGVQGDVDAQTGRCEIAKIETAGLTLRGPVRYDLNGDTPSLSGELEFDADLAKLMETFGDLLTLPPLLADDFALGQGALHGSLEIDGSIPASTNEDSFAMLDLVQGEGTVRDVQLVLLGETFALTEGSWALRDRSLRLTELDLSGPGLGATGEMVLPATLDGALSGSLHVDADLGSLRDAATRVWPKLPAEQTEGKTVPAEWPGLSGKAQGDVTLEFPLPPPPEGMEGAQLAADITLAPIGVRPPAWSEDLRVKSGSVKATFESANLHDVAVEGPGFAGVVNGEVTGWPETLEMNGVARFDRFDLDALQASLAPEETAGLWRFGVETAWADEESEMWIPPENLVIRGTAHAALAVVREYQLQDVTAQGVLANQTLEVSAAEGVLGGGKVTGTANVDWTTPVPQWKAAGNANEVDASAVFQPFAGPLASAISSKLTGDLDLSGPVSAVPEDVKNELTGSGDLLSAAGQLLTEPLLSDTLDQFLGAFASRFETLDFESLRAGLEFDDGRVMFDDVVVRGPTSVAASGWVGLLGRCDYRLTVTLPPDVTPELGSLSPAADLLRDADGRIAFDVAVTGPAAKPRVAVDMAQLAQRATDRGARELEDRVRGALEDLLPGGGTTGTDSVKQGLEDKLRDDAKGALDGLLKGIKGKKKKG